MPRPARLPLSSFTIYHPCSVRQHFRPTHHQPTPPNPSSGTSQLSLSPTLLPGPPFVSSFDRNLRQPPSSIPAHNDYHITSIPTPKVRSFSFSATTFPPDQPTDQPTNQPTGLVCSIDLSASIGPYEQHWPHIDDLTTSPPNPVTTNPDQLIVVVWKPKINQSAAMAIQARDYPQPGRQAF